MVPDRRSPGATRRTGRSLLERAHGAVATGAHEAPRCTPRVARASRPCIGGALDPRVRHPLDRLAHGQVEDLSEPRSNHSLGNRAAISEGGANARRKSPGGSSYASGDDCNHDAVGAGRKASRIRYRSVRTPARRRQCSLPPQCSPYPNMRLPPTAARLSVDSL